MGTGGGTRGGGGAGGADWLEEARRGKLPGMFALQRSIGPHPAVAGPLAPPAGGSVGCSVRRAGWVGSGLRVGERMHRVPGCPDEGSGGFGE